MIYTTVNMTIGDYVSVCDKTIVLYRGDKNVEIRFIMYGNKFTVLDSTHAQMIITRPSTTSVFSKIAPIQNDTVILTISEDMIDELTEVGCYDMQIRLYDDSMKSRVTIPPAKKAIEVREPIATDESFVDIATVGYAKLQTDSEDEEDKCFDENGNYIKTYWEHGDIITAGKLNKIEDSLESINANDIQNHIDVNDKIDALAESINAAEYVTETELNDKGYLTEHQDISGKADKSEIPTKTSQLTNDSGFLTQIPSEYVTETELNDKGYLTEHQDISGKADKSELHNHSNKSVLDGITASKVSSWDNKSDFDGNYNSLTNKPSIPSIEGLATENYVNDKVEDIDLTSYVKTVNGVSPNEDGNVTISATLEPPTVVDSMEEMVDTNKQYVLSTDGYIYAYKQNEGITTPNFTNLADTGSSDWLTDYRLSTSSTSSRSGAYVTNYIPCKLNDVIRIKGMHIDYYSNSTAHKSRIHVLDSNKALVASDCGYLTGLVDAGYASSDGDITTVTAGYAGASSTTINGYSSTAYERFCGYLIDGYTLDDVIITVNEEIAYTTAGGYAWTSTGISYTSVDYSVVIQEIQNDIDNLEATISNLDGTSIPSYWVSELETKMDIIQQTMESIGRNKSSFFWYTDAHWQNNAKNSPLILDYLIKNTPINKVNFGGDIVGDPSPYDHTNIKSFYDWQKAIADIPNHHSVYGNHDLNHWTTDVHNMSYSLILAHEESDDMVVSKIDGCYYIDNPSEKTRYLYISYLTTSQTDMMTQGQFIVDSIKSTKSGWHIIVIAHRWFQYSSSSTPTIGSVPTYESEILSVLDAYNTRVTRGGSNYFYEQDFTNCKGVVEFCIGGHIHVDYDFTSSGGIPIIITASDTNQERAGEEDEDCGTVGTITEQALYSIIADYENRKVHVIGIGRGGSRELPLLEIEIGDEIENRVETLESESSTSGGTSSEVSTLPDYWISRLNDIGDKIDTLQKENGMDTLQFLWCSDIHGVPGTSPSNTTYIGEIGRYMMDKYNIPFFMVSGDIMSQASHTDTANIWAEYDNLIPMLSPINNEEFLAIRGNHDGVWGSPTEYNGQTGQYYHSYIGDKALFNAFMRRQTLDRYKRVFGKDGMYFYIDYHDYRIYMLNTHTFGDNSTNDNGQAVYNGFKHFVLGSEQIQWVADTLKTVNEGQEVIFVAHARLDQTIDYSVFNTMIEGYISGANGTSSIDISGTYWGTDEDYAKSTVDFDFSNVKGNVIGWFNGHNHSDSIATDLFANIPLFGITTAGGDVRDSYYTDGTLTRTKETATETAIDLVTITSDYIYFTRIGSGYDREYNRATKEITIDYDSAYIPPTDSGR